MDELERMAKDIYDSTEPTEAWDTLSIKKKEPYIAQAEYLIARYAPKITRTIIRVTENHSDREAYHISYNGEEIKHIIALEYEKLDLNG